MEKFDTQEATFNFFVKKGVNAKINKESLMAVYLPNNNYQRMHLYEFPVIKENKWRIGAITKYDIPQYIRNIPEEFPVFCTIKEAGMLRNIKKKEEKKKKIQDNNNNIILNNDKNNNLANINTTNINILDEPIPNEMHKYCHLCKKQFDNYLRHINSKNHKDTALKYNDTFKSIKNIFGRVNTFWNNKTNNNTNNNKDKKDIEINNSLSQNDSSITFNDLNDDKLLKLKLFSQFNNNSTREGCKAKKKILISNNSQLSTAQSFPIIPPKKRKKNDIKKSKDKSKSKKNKINNKSINEFLIRGEFLQNKKISNDEIKNVFYE